MAESASFASYTTPGTKYSGLNQDYCVSRKFVDRDKKTSCIVFALLDGHNLLGENAAKTGGESLMEFFHKVAVSLFRSYDSTLKNVGITKLPYPSLMHC